MIPYGKQDISQQDIDAVVAVLKSTHLTQGQQVPLFEGAMSQYTRANYAVAVNSATSALHIACLALGVTYGDIVWTSPITFVASANCARYCGAEIDFVDVEPLTGNLSPDRFEQKLRQAKRSGKLPKVVIPVHLAGHPCDMKRVHDLAKSYGVAIIEDASHAIGSRNTSLVGSCEYSDITVFSFHPVKIITSAEGGVAMTNSLVLAEKMRKYRCHGITSTPCELVNPEEGAWYYEQQLLGFNYRMTDIHAALGKSQMNRLELFVERRNQLASRYQQLLTSLPVTSVLPQDASYSSWHLYIVRLNDPTIRKAVFDKIRAAGIMVHVHYFPVHLQPYFQNMGFKQGDFPAAEAFYSQILTLPLFPGLTDSEQDMIVETLSEVL